MITLFTTPKPFKDHFNIIQRNAIRSWLSLQPKPEIIILDDVEGAKEIAEEFGLKYIPEIKKNEFGTPLVNDIFEVGCKYASNDMVCYINADIVLTQSFADAVKKVISLFKGGDFLLIGRRCNVLLEKEWNFSQEKWEEELEIFASQNGSLESAGATDYFIFPKRIDWGVLPFAIGRGAWDGWFLYNAHKKKIPVIDGTEIITVYHQQHDFCTHWKQFDSSKKYSIYKSKEYVVNERLRGSYAHQYTILDSSYFITPAGLQSSPIKCKILANILRLRMCVSYHLYFYYPYSYPLIKLIRFIKNIVKRIKKWI